MITRRRFGLITGGALASVAFGGACRQTTVAREANDGRLTARPQDSVNAQGKIDRFLGLDSARDAILQLPSKAAGTKFPLVVMLHGAGQSAEWMLERVSSAADDAGVAVLAPYSRDPSWDAVHDRFGPDITFLNRALERVFETVPVDPARTAVGGFSDGATYALSIGLINGDLFRRVIAFSPGFIVDGTPVGTPKIFISHGTRDPILPIDRCSRRIIRELKGRGYNVTFREFDGGHQVPAEIALEGMSWVASELATTAFRL